MTPDVTAEDAPTSKWFGSYLLLEALPAYGMVQPYVARADGRVGLCVVKRLLPALEGNPTARARFAREARIGAQLQHPGIVPFVGHGVEGTTAFLAVDFLVGEPLQAALAALARAGSRLPLPLFRTIALSVLDALSFAHRARSAEGTPLGIVHRDLTPRNIILTFAGEVKISDFGVARLNADDFKTVPGIAVGTLEYLSPEQATGQTVDARSDLYTLSALFYEMLAGKPVIPPGTTTVATLSLVANVEPTPLVTLRPDLSPRLAGVIERGMAKDREVRFQSAAEMKVALESALGPSPAAGPEALSRFLRELLPDSEARMIQLMDRIRDQAATAPPRPSQIGADGVVRPGEMDRASPSQLATMVVRDRSTPRGGTPSELVSDEPPEPSVMTMPGTLVRGGEPAPMPQVSTIPSGNVREPVPSLVGPAPRRGTMILVLGVALLLVVAALLLRPQAPEPMLIDDPPAPSADPPVVTAALKPGEPRAAEAEPTAPAEVSPPPRSEVLEAKGPPSKRRVPNKEPGEAAAVSSPPPPASPPPAPPPAESPYAGLRQKIRAMIAAQPKKDVRTFDEVRGALARLSKDLPEPTRQKVASKLSSADLAQDVEELGQALELIERSRAQLE
ncbi:MAG: serine/threonine protein kinase [Deltaproteobacteria bacterium]|jgi:serine/threonine protein kinase|nr:serine/threonine protein kinase [Deltaproteobacteria bacterium]